jgi:transcription factor SOX1/3/14/21 (SOX group B)
MVWSRTARATFQAENPALANNQISKLLGTKWKSLTVAEKLPFVDQSKRLKAQHERDHPDFRYGPRVENQLLSLAFPTAKRLWSIDLVSADPSDVNWEELTAAVLASFNHDAAAKKMEASLKATAKASLKASRGASKKGSTASKK